MQLKFIREHAIIAISTFVFAIIFNTITLPFGIVIGGSSGLSIIIDHLFGIEPAIIVLICYLGALFIGYIFLGKEVIKKSLFGTLIYPLWIYILAPLRHYVSYFGPLNTEDYLIIVVACAVISGFIYGIVYKMGYTTGGSDIASQIFNKYSGFTIGSANFIINSIIVISGGLLFGWTKVMYAVLTLYIIGITTDKVLLGISYSKTFYIVTDKVDEVKIFISKKLKQNATELESVGGYTEEGSIVLMCVLPTEDYYKLRKAINTIDKKAFFVILDAYQMQTRA